MFANRTYIEIINAWRINVPRKSLQFHRATLRGYWAFIPAPLPPEISYAPPLVLALSRADAALSELSGLGRHIINPHLLIASYIRKEAVLSSRFEGTRAGIADLLRNDYVATRILRLMENSTE